MTSQLLHNYNYTEPNSDDIYWMNEALKEAKKAFDRNEVPVGCVIIGDGRILGKGHNLTETLTDVTAHAEMQTITAAASAIGGKYLTECTIYVTLEPCVMCAGAIAWAQLGRLVWAANDTKKGFTTVNQRLLHPKTRLTQGVLIQESETLLKDFFKKLR